MAFFIVFFRFFIDFERFWGGFWEVFGRFFRRFFAYRLKNLIRQKHTKNMCFYCVFKGSSSSKLTKKHQKIDKKSMQIWNKEKSPQTSLKNRFWERLGLHLEGGWDALGPVLGALGRFLAVFLAFKINLFSIMGPRWAPASHLDRFLAVLE